MKRSLLALGMCAASIASAVEPVPLTLEYQVPLGGVAGRIDHLALDVDRQRLFVAEFGNDSLGVVDLRSRRVVRTLRGLSEPQGVAYAPDLDEVFVADAGDGSLRMFSGADNAPLGRMELGSDADNIRVDGVGHQVLIGHSDGAIGIVNAASAHPLATIRLKGHPEGFQLDPYGTLVWVNVPDAREIAVVDRRLDRQTASWPQRYWRGNFPMAFDAEHRRVVVAFRQPARVAAIDIVSGQAISAIDTCSDADDVFVDARRHRLYVSCGEGYVDVLGESGHGYVRIARLATARGARTSYFSPDLDRLFVAVPAAGGTPAAIWVFKPIP